MIYGIECGPPFQNEKCKRQTIISRKWSATIQTDPSTKIIRQKNGKILLLFSMMILSSKFEYIDNNSFIHSFLWSRIEFAVYAFNFKNWFILYILFFVVGVIFGPTEYFNEKKKKMFIKIENWITITVDFAIVSNR